jgi:hypothetical protein
LYAGIQKYVEPAEPEMLESVNAKIMEYYNNLDALGKSTFDLTAAQKRATEFFAKQSEFYGLYEEAMKELNPDTIGKSIHTFF